LDAVSDEVGKGKSHAGMKWERKKSRRDEVGKVYTLAPAMQAQAF
jgi:hypothetical protein